MKREAEDKQPSQIWTETSWNSPDKLGKYFRVSAEGTKKNAKLENIIHFFFSISPEAKYPLLG